MDGFEYQLVTETREIIDRLRAAMARKGVSKADVARACQISEQAVSQWFSKNRASKSNLIKAAGLCNMSVSELFTGDDEMREISSLPDGQFLIAGAGVREVVDRESVDIALAWRDLPLSVRRRMAQILGEHVGELSAKVRRLVDGQ